MSQLTQILNSIEQGDPHAAEELLPLVYEELRKLAAAKLAQEKPGQTLEATALVHEAYLRLMIPARESESRAPDVSPGQKRHWDSRRHFFAAAAEAMRRILIEKARRKRRQRHGGGLLRVELLEQEVALTPGDERVLVLDDALTRLAAIRPQAAEIVKLRFFSGLSIEEAAPVVGISPRTARRLWVFARAWLRREMERQADPQS
jgi:RNA polymerase sigma factor (TIGR02999 family)